MNSAIISIISGSDSLTLGTLGVFTSALLRYITMRGEPRQNDCSGWQSQEGDGGSTGRVPIAARKREVCEARPQAGFVQRAEASLASMIFISLASCNDFLS
jgi:hypothetical protein